MGEALNSTSGRPPVLYGLIKDHKLVPQGEDPPVRPVCGANKGRTAKHSSQMADIIDPFNQEIAQECWVESTEELLSWIEKFNEDSNSDQLEVFSNDAKALFPSILIAITVMAVRTIIMESRLELRNIDAVEISRMQNKHKLSLTWQASTILSNILIKKQDQ